MSLFWSNLPEPSWVFDFCFLIESSIKLKSHFSGVKSLKLCPLRMFLNVSGSFFQVNNHEDLPNLRQYLGWVDNLYFSENVSLSFHFFDLRRFLFVILPYFLPYFEKICLSIDSLLQENFWKKWLVKKKSLLRHFDSKIIQDLFVPENITICIIYLKTVWLAYILIFLCSFCVFI